MRTRASASAPDTHCMRVEEVFENGTAKVKGEARTRANTRTGCVIERMSVGVL